MTILNYTTKIDAFKTIGEIQMCLAKHGAKRIMIDYEEAIPIAVAFEVNNVSFALPCNYEGVLEVMKNDKKIARTMCTIEQAIRVAWRIILDWVKAQIAITEAGLATISEVFFPYAITNDGTTVYKRLMTTDKLILKE